jgi:hypothetical protein
MSGVPFSRKELRERIGWSETQVRRNIDQLVELGYVGRINGRQGSTFRYLLLDDGSADPEFCFGGDGEPKSALTTMQKLIVKQEPRSGSIQLIGERSDKNQQLNPKSSPLRPSLVTASPTV